ncbi:hypothetical protein POM88_038950 [Heracleum sosnowskyi]|uniref:Uncharacterized protein n=1 Tax=Heracleum sosnowskyi TaxID=360622 RepID=A0AAD8HBP1_9APIA|nr:hypothetical protein POM88_038950 [Heracleum sosnowskyi]
MVQLYLSEPAWNDIEDDASVKQRISLLIKLEMIILSLMSSGGRSEARLWLCNTLSSMTSISPHNQQEVFVKLLRCKPRKLGLASQLLQMIFEKRPKRVGAILAKNSHRLESFFRGHPDRIMQWFSSFAGSDDSQHRKGAKALSQFAFVNRDICWEELEWKGKHGQSPAVVATKPHYFLDIDIQQTVENFLEYVPEFWSSREFAESLEGGEILFMDSKFFVQLFLDLMYKEDLKEMWEVIDEFLMEESFSSLCQHLLIVLEEKDLLLFLELSRKFFKLKKEHMTIGRQLVRLIREEEAHEEKMQIQDIVLQSFALHYRLLEESQTNESWEIIFRSNGISFRNSENPSLLSKSSSWLLSTDGYSTTWNTVDLPEHLSMHCFSTWMKWIFAKWDVAV